MRPNGGLPPILALKCTLTTVTGRTDAGAEVRAPKPAASGNTLLKKGLRERARRGSMTVATEPGASRTRIGLYRKTARMLPPGRPPLASSRMKGLSMNR